jgi:pSer/pThr/pTyr-binding forkhead associated (FHA) protein/tetratricopeptide (TPR) repeat protein
MPPPRKTGARARVDDDPERANNTVARGKGPLPSSDDPEVANATVAKAPNPLPDDEDPERENRTQAKASRPAPKPKRAPSRVEEPIDEGSGYSTGQNYQAMEDDVSSEQLAGMSLDGEGLDALDPELAPKTKALPALKEPVEGEGGGDEEDDANATRAGPPIKLEITGGPDAGKKKRFKGVRMVIGRTPGVDLQLSDQSVSRRHIELVHSDGGTLLRDLGSGNGTRLNGKKITDDTMLSHGDEIQIGKTKIRFVDELSAFKKAREDAEKKEAAAAEGAEEEKAEESEEAKADDGEAEAEAAAEGEGDATEEGEAGAEEGEAAAEEGEPKKKARDRKPVRTSRQVPQDTGLAAKLKAMNPKVRLGIIGGAVVVLLLLVVGIATRPPPPPPVDPRAEQAALKMQEARSAVKDGNYEAAARLVDEAERLSPGIDKTKLGVQAREAMGIARNFEQVKKFIAEKRFEDAKKLLTDTPKGNIKAEAERTKLEDEITLAQVEFKKEKVREFIAAGEFDSARQTMSELPGDQLGDLPEKLAEGEREVEALKQQEAKDARLGAAAAAAAAKARREEQVALAFAIVERKFMGGEWERAASECARVIEAYGSDKDIVARARSLAAQIPGFGRNYDEGMRKYRQGQLTQAARPLRMAWQAYRSMGLTQNKYGDELAQNLLKAALAAGKEALIREDLENAMANFREARRIDPQDPDARKGFDAVSDKAEDLYQSGYMLKDRDPREALKKFKTVIAVTEAGTPVHEKAKNQVAAMAP